MVVHRSHTKYRKVRDQGDLGEDADDIELLGSNRYRRNNKLYMPSTH